MTRSRPALVTAAALLLALGGMVATLIGTAGAQAATSTLCQSQTASVSGGTYIVQNNEWGSSAAECITTDGNAGLKTNSFSVSVSGSTQPPPTSPPPTSPPPTGSGACTGSYSIVNSWPGGFQAQVVVKNTGSGTLNGWRLGWTFPGNQAITSLWNGSYTQSGAGVSVTNASYDGTLAPGSTATVGSTATGATASPAVTCS